MGQFLVHVGNKGFAAGRDDFVADADELLDVLRLQFDHSQGQIFLGDGGRAFAVFVGRIRGAFKRALEVALEGGLVDAAQNLVAFPSGFDDGIHQGGNRHLSAGCGVFAQQGAAFAVIFTLEIPRERFHVFLASADFIHGFPGLFSLAGFSDVDAGGTAGDGLAGFLRLRGGFADLLGVLAQLVHFALQRVQVGAFLLHLLQDLGLALFDLFHGLVLHGFPLR